MKHLLPSYMTASAQWIYWQTAPAQSDPNKLTKLPKNPNPLNAGNGAASVSNGNKNLGDFASTQDPDTWSSIDRAMQTLGLLSPNPPLPELPKHGLGFIFCAGQPIYGVDLDYSLLPLYDGASPLSAKERIAEGYSPLEPEQFAYQQNFLNNLLKSGTYYEISPSGTGHHFICGISETIAQSDSWHHPIDGWGLAFVNHEYGIEAYRGERFFTMNPGSQPSPTAPVIIEIDQLATMLFSKTSRRVAYDPNDPNSSLERITDFGRKLDLADETIIELASNVNKAFLQHLNATPNTPQHFHNQDWSSTLNVLVGDLDKVCGDPGQVYRIIANSSFIMQAGEDHAGHDREQKFTRTYNDNLLKARKSNNMVLEGRSVRSKMAEHGAALYEAYKANPDTEAAKEQIFDDEEARLDRIEADEREEEFSKTIKGFDGLSHDNVKALDLLKVPYMDMRNLPPPGRMGVFIQDLKNMALKSNTEVAISLGFTLLSGVISRRFKDELYGTGPIIIAVIAAISASGKSSTITAGKTILRDANTSLRQLRRGNSDFPTSEQEWIHDVNPGSAHGLFDQVVPRGVGVLHTDEAGGLIERITKKQTSADGGLADFLLACYDTSRFTTEVGPSESRATQKAGNVRTQNPSQSVLMMTTGEKGLAFGSSQLVDGFGSRMTFIYPESGTELATPRLAQSQERASYQVNNRIQQLLSMCLPLQKLYESMDAWKYARSEAMNAKPPQEFTKQRPPDPVSLETYMVFPPEVSQAINDDGIIFDTFSTDLSNGEIHTLPPHYIALARVIPNAIRYAQILGMMNSDGQNLQRGDGKYILPTGRLAEMNKWYYFLNITVAEWKWALHYVLYNTLRLIRLEDEGQLVGSSNDAVVAAIRVWRKNHKGRKLQGTATLACPRGNFMRGFKMNTCTYLYDAELKKKTQNVLNANKLLEKLLELGIFEEVIGRTGDKGRIGKMLISTHHPEWSAAS